MPACARLEALGIVSRTRHGDGASAPGALALKEPRGDLVILEARPDHEDVRATAHALVRRDPALIDEDGRRGGGVTHQLRHA